MSESERYIIKISKGNNLIKESNVTAIWSYLAQEEFEKSGIFVEASFEEIKMVCSPENGCKDHVTDGIRIISIRNPNASASREEYNLAIGNIFNELRKFYQNSYILLTVEEVDISVFL